MLRRLTRLIQQPEAINALVHAHNPLVWTMDYPNGLHARPATRWVETAKRYACELRVYKDAEFADAKTLTDLLALGVTCGANLRWPRAAPTPNVP